MSKKDRERIRNEKKQNEAKQNIIQDLENQKKLQETEQQVQQQNLEYNYKLKELELKKQQQDAEHKQKLLELEKQNQKPVSLDEDKIIAAILQKLSIPQQNNNQPQALDEGKLVDAILKKLPTQTSNVEINYDKIANMLNGQPVNIQQNTIVQDKCSLKTQELTNSLKQDDSFYKNLNKIKDAKEGAELIYTLHKQIKLIENSYDKVFHLADMYHDKAENTKKTNKKFYTTLSDTKNSLLGINSANDDAAAAIKAGIAKIKQALPNEISNHFNAILSALQSNDELSTIAQDYCNSCSNTLDNMNEHDKLMYFSVCGARMKIDELNSEFVE